MLFNLGYIMLKVENLSVKRNGDSILRNLSFHVHRGEIYGLIGANGAGKTTLIKALLSLVHINDGSIKIDGASIEEDSAQANAGSLIEHAPLYNQLSAYDNLRISAIQLNVDKVRIAEVLQIIGLSNEGKKKVNNFSLGMKQRLGLGIAILNNPGLLILDEPTNGLDPDGITQVRELLLRMNKDSGTTIVIASHLLSEVEKIVTHIGLIKKGVLAFDGSLASFKKTDSLEGSYKTFTQ